MNCVETGLTGGDCTFWPLYFSRHWYVAVSPKAPPFTRTGTALLTGAAVTLREIQPSAHVLVTT